MFLKLLDRLTQSIPHKGHAREWNDPHGPSRMQILPSFLFDEDYYLSQVGELEFEEGDAFDHYIKHGIPVGKWPNPWFDPEFYRAQFPDDPGAQSNPLLHYLKKGAELNAQTCKAIPELSVTQGRITPLGEYIRSGSVLKDSKAPANQYRIQPEIRKQLAGLKVVLDVENQSLMMDGGRYLFTLAAFAFALGCRLYVRNTKAFQKSLSKLRFHQDIIDWFHPENFELQASYPDESIVFADRTRPTGMDHVKTWIWLNRVPSMNLNEEILYKVPMHPTRYKFGTHRLLRSARNTRRRHKIMFCGSSGILYRHPIIGMRFGKLSRNLMLRTLQRDFSERITYLDEQELNNKTDDKAEILLGLNRQARIPGLYWLQWLSRTNFFICMSGAYFPMSHSLAESMAVGTIPILEYPEITDPPLEDGVNCIAFRDKAGFQDAIQRALDMDEEQIQEMKQHVIEYYEKHLCFAKFTGSLLTNEGKDLLVKIPFEFPFPE